MEVKTFYLCDGRVENCRKTACYKIGGECRHTNNETHAINAPEKRLFIDIDPDILWEVEPNKGCEA